MTHILLRSGRLLVLLLPLLVAGCALFDDDDEELGPAPLTDIVVEQRFKKVWGDSVGNGQGGIYNRLAPAIAGELIVAAAANGDVEAFNRLTGKSVWDIDLDRAVTGGVGVGGGRAYVATADGRLWALSLESGEVLWDSPLGGEMLAPPAADKDLVVATTFDGRLIGLDAATGERRWSYSSSTPVLMLRAASAPLMYEQAVVAGFANGKVVAVSRDNGQLFWESRVGTSKGASEIERLADIAGDLLIDDGTLYAVAYQGELNAVEVRSGRRLWARPASSYVGLAEGFSNIYVASAEGSVIAFDQNNQGVRWEQSALARRQLSGPAVIGNYVVVGDLEGYVHLLAQADGRIAARIKVDGDGVRAAPLAADDLLYIFGNGGKIVAYRLEAKQ